MSSSTRPRCWIPNASASLDLDTIRTVCDELLAAHSEALAPGLRS